jgi:cytochrome c
VRLALAVLLLVAATRAGAEEGRRIFEANCASCHAAEPGAPAGAGPNLAGLIGREVAGDRAFDYSPALRDARATGQVWDAAMLDRFLADPEEMFPGLWMGGNGLARAAERAAVVAYLKAISADR